jgi:phosphoenolpyruvate-protein kinase (PTS system EI component)
MTIAIHGLAVARGIAIGRAVLVASSRVDVAHYFIESHQVEAELERVNNARHAVSDEIQRLIKNMPKDKRLGIVSLSTGILRTAELLVHSLRGDELLVMTAQTSDQSRLYALVRAAHTIIADPISYPLVKKAILGVREHLMRIPELISSKNYIDENSIDLLKRELGI